MRPQLLTSFTSSAGKKRKSALLLLATMLTLTMLGPPPTKPVVSPDLDRWMGGLPHGAT